MRIPLLHSLFLATALFLALLPACGGGGGGGLPDPGPGPGGSARAEELIEACLPLGLDSFFDVTAALQSVLNGSGAAAGVSIAPGGLDTTSMDGRIAWQLELGGGAPPEVTGNLTFADGMGGRDSPITAQDVMDLQASGIDALGAIVAMLADGTVVAAEWNAPPPTTYGGQLSGALTGGVLGTTMGLALYDDGTCNVSLDWSAGTLAQLQTPTPTVVLAVSILDDVDNLAGTLTATGSSTAALSTSLNGGASENWSYDLATGLATAQ